MNQKIKILLAEDHAIVRESIHNLLEQETDFEIIGEAADGEQVIKMARETNPDVILMDIAMPKLSGIEATRRVKKICPGVSVLILSAYNYEQYIFALLEAGAAGYLLKDVSTRELANAIRAVHRGEAVLHHEITQKVMKRLRNKGNQEDHKMVMVTRREREVLSVAAKGMKNKEIADHLHVSVRTVEAHLSSIFHKLGVGSRTEAILHALRTGLLTIEDLQHYNETPTNPSGEMNY